MGRISPLQKAISRFAALFPNGELLASIDPVSLLDGAIEELTFLRTRLAEAESIVDEMAEESCFEYYDTVCPERWPDNRDKWCVPCRADAIVAARGGEEG